MLGDSRAPKTALNLRVASDVATNDRCARSSASVPLRALVTTAVCAVVLASALYEILPGSHPSSAPAAGARSAPHRALTSLPLALQGPASQALGGADQAYEVNGSGGGLAAANPAERLSVRFAPSGISVRAGATHVGLSLRGVGYGSSLNALGQIAPHASANRVLYRRAGLSEWYVNGPFGLEQGFTVARAPSPEAAGPLTLAVALSGNARAALASSGQRITLTHAGGPTLRYSGLSATDARGRVLHSWLQLRAGVLLFRVNARAARYPLRIDPFVQQKEKLTGTGEVGQGAFGASVALSADGNTALIGAPNDDRVVATEGEVTEKSKIVKGLASTSNILVGSKVDGENIPGGTEVVKVRSATEVELSLAVEGEGTATVKEALTFTRQAVGEAFVFTRTGSSWTQQAELAEPQNASKELEEIGEGRLGESVALSPDGNTALLGAPDDNKGAGAAWVYTRSAEKWTKQGSKLTGTGEVTSAEHPGEFGESVALGGPSGNTALIGGPGDKEGLGAAWVFTRSSGVWKQQAEIREPLSASKAKEEIGKGAFGFSVALGGPDGPEGTTALIGAPEDHEAVGAAWVYRRNSASAWIKQEPKLTGSGENGTAEFGQTVALEFKEGNTALIGGPNNATTLEREGEVTEGSKTVKGLPSTSGIFAGTKVSGTKISAGTSVARVINEAEVELNAKVQGTGGATVKEKLTFTSPAIGAAWVFMRSSEKWTEQAKLTASGEVGKGHFGEGVALAPNNGNTALIGAARAQAEVGAMWVFTRSGTTWTQQEQLAFFEGAGSRSTFGYSAALSSEGTTALIGGFADNIVTGAAWVFVTGQAPTVVTEAASPVGKTTATLRGTVNPNSSPVVECVFEYGPGTSYGSKAPCEQSPGSGTSPVPVSAAITNLNPDTTYHFRLVATDVGTSHGADSELATLPQAPTVLTEEASSVTGNSATLNATVNPNATGQPAPITECKFEYGTTSEPYEASVPCATTPGSKEHVPVPVSATVNNLNPNTTYHFRIVANNAGGESGGLDKTLKTLVLPSVVTGEASALAQTSATVAATVNPNGFQVAECKFEYGPTEAYGSSASCAPPPESGESAVPVSAGLESLNENATYHYRIMATGANGTSFGVDKTFTTTLELGPHWYKNGVKLHESTLEEGVSTMTWGTLTLESSSVGAITCETLGGGFVANLPGGGAGKGALDGFATYNCVGEVCELTGGKLEVIPEKLPWTSVIREEGVGVFKEKIESIHLGVRCTTGSVVEFHGSLRPTLKPGTVIGSGPSRLEFAPSSGSLQSEAGATAAATGELKLMGYEGGEIVRPKNP